MTALPMPDSLSLLWSSTLRLVSSRSSSCRIRSDGSDLSGIGASQSVITDNTLA